MKTITGSLGLSLRTLAICTLATAITAPAWALKTVTPEEASDGWISLFDGETLFGWTQLGDVEWKTIGDNLVAESGTGGWIATTSQFADFELVIKLRVMAGLSAGLVVRGGLEGHTTENGGAVITIRSPRDAEPQWREIRVTARGAELSATIDGEAVQGLEARRSRGYIGIQYHTYHGRRRNRVEVSEIKLRPLSMESIFNGRNLDGWNVIPDHASVFTVVDGAINIKDGNGQIETAGVYKDFLLQLDIISSGEHLNSGVFFRGPVGVFWKGYESQVRNEWTGSNRNDPVDFGTGGNYGNQPARMVVSSDHEWFKKTIVCDGNHTAIWINGYLVSDFTDVRPASRQSDGKNGYVSGPGTIHLQGHDPTTDLSFKNIGIQVYD